MRRTCSLSRSSGKRAWSFHFSPLLPRVGFGDLLAPGGVERFVVQRDDRFQAAGGERDVFGCGDSVELVAAVDEPRIQAADQDVAAAVVEFVFGFEPRSA